MSTENNSKRRSKIGRWIAFILVVLLLGGYGLYTLRINVSSEKPRVIEGYELWQQEVVDVARDISVQDGGRIKPFSTWAGFTMLQLHGARGMKIEAEGEVLRLAPKNSCWIVCFAATWRGSLPIFRDR